MINAPSSARSKANEGRSGLGPETPLDKARHPHVEGHQHIFRE